MNTLMNGIWSGILATGPMTLTLFQLQDKTQALPKSSLPPAKLTKEILSKSYLTRPLVSNRHENMTMLSHFGFGIACATLYALVSPKVKAEPVAKGAAFGLAVWATSYFGVMPAFGLKASGDKLTSKRNLQMVAAHIVWGLALGRAEHAFRKRDKQMLTDHSI